MTTKFEDKIRSKFREATETAQQYDPKKHVRSAEATDNANFVLETVNDNPDSTKNLGHAINELRNAAFAHDAAKHELASKSNYVSHKSLMSGLKYHNDQAETFREIANDLDKK